MKGSIGFEGTGVGVFAFHFIFISSHFKGEGYNSCFNYYHMPP